MQQQPGKVSRLKRPVLILLVLLLFALVSILLVSLIAPHNTPDEPIVPPDSIPNVGSVSENVESIEIDQLTLYPVPEISIGGTLTGVLMCFLSIAVFTTFKKRSQKRTSR